MNSRLIVIGCLIAALAVLDYWFSTFNLTLVVIPSIVMGALISLLPASIPTTSDEIRANAEQYALHRQYYGETILEAAGSMTLVSSRSVRLVPEPELAWVMDSPNALGKYLPEMAESRIPLYNDVFLAHLSTETEDPVWTRLKSSWEQSRKLVDEYTQSRRRFDNTFIGKLEALILSKIGTGVRADWDDVRMPNTIKKVGPTRYQAAQFRDDSENWYSGAYQENVGWFWQVLKAFHRESGWPWTVAIGEKGITYLWGPEAEPDNLSSLPGLLEEVRDSLRYDTSLAGLWRDAVDKEEAAQATLPALRNAALDAVYLLQQGPEIPGSCRYCEKMVPRR